MDPLTNLRTETSLYFDLVNFDELNENWIKGVVHSEFTGAEENNISLGVLFAGDPFSILCNLGDVCLNWCNAINESFTNSDTSTLDQSLWTVLEGVDITAEKFQSFIYLLCSRAAKINDAKELSENENDALMKLSQGLACARLYFNIMRVPSTGTFSVYNNHLFQLCLSCFPAPDFSSNSNENQIIYDFDELTDIYVPALFSLISVLKECHLGDDPDTMNHTVGKLCDLAACEVHMGIQFDIEYFEMELKRRFRLPSIVAILAYKAFSAILSSDINGDKDENFLLIVSHLNKHISCSRALKSTSLTQKHNCIKDNAVAFVCHHLRSQNFAQEATNEALKRLCVVIIDRNEIRIATCKAIVVILLHIIAEYRIEFIEWLLLLTDSEETRLRIIALEIFNQILINTKKPDTDVLPESSRKDMLKFAIIFSILTRCEDEAAAVRQKALTVLSENMECILKALDKTKDWTTFEKEEVDNISNYDLEINGNHRFFWYNLNSFRARLNEIEAMLQRRMKDINVHSRKATFIALERLIVFDETFITEENLKYFDYGAKDSSIQVKNQVMDSLSAILNMNIYSENKDIQSTWLKCILPLVVDSDTTVQAKALSFLQEQFLQNIFSSEQRDCEKALVLLKNISSDDFLSYQKYFQKAFVIWKSERKLRPRSIVQLKKYVGTEWEECVWFYILNFSFGAKIPPEMIDPVVSKFEEFDASGTYSQSMKYLAKIVSNSCDVLKEKDETVCQIIRSRLETFTITFEIIPLYIEILYKIYKHKNATPDFDKFSSSVVQKCVQDLTEIKSTVLPSRLPSHVVLAIYFSIIQEFCLMCPTNIKPNVTDLLKIFSGINPPKPLTKLLTSKVRAHAYIALGKICLQDEKLAKTLIKGFITEMLSSKFDVIRNNLALIAIELCRRYTAFAEKYISKICDCLKDKVYIIRYQTFILLANLLQEEYIKWRGQLFYCILSTLVDEKESIQDLGRYCLSQLLCGKKSTIFCEHFIHAIFIFNYFCPPDKKSVAKSVKELEKFSLPGEHRREERMLLYKFLLNSMSGSGKAYVYECISNLLASMADSVYPLDETTECIIRDIFAILTCKESKAVNLEDLDIEALEIVEAGPIASDLLWKKELETRKKLMIDPIVPVIVRLKSIVKHSNSDLMEAIISFLKEFLYDFKDNLKEVLRDDVLVRQLELRFRTDAEAERTKKKKKG